MTTRKYTVREYLHDLITSHGREYPIPLYVATAGDLADLYAKLDEQKAEIEALKAAQSEDGGSHWVISGGDPLELDKFIQETRDAMNKEIPF